MTELPSPERRIAARVAVERPITLATDAGEWAATTVNVSTSGMLVALGGELTIWAEVVLVLPGIGPREARVARRDGDHYGLVLREPLTADDFAAFTGVELAVRESVLPLLPKRAGRTAPWAFGRDRLKTLKREAAARAEVGR